MQVEINVKVIVDNRGIRFFAEGSDGRDICVSGWFGDSGWDEPHIPQCMRDMGDALIRLHLERQSKIVSAIAKKIEAAASKKAK